MNRDRHTLEVSIPPTTPARVHVPSAQPGSILESGGHPDPSDADVQFLRLDRAAGVYQVRSGQYRFESMLA